MAGWKECFKEENSFSRFKNCRAQVLEFKERLTISDLGMGLGISLFFAFFFYRSTWAVIPMVPVGVVFVVQRQKKRIRKSRQDFLLQFKECVLSVEASLQAGYAVENAFAESIADMEIMFGEDSIMVEELRVLGRGLRNNETLENLLHDMAARSGLEEIKEFAEVFGIAKRNSGNIPDTIAIYSRIISNKLELEAEVETLLAAKQLEQRVMNVMPFFIVLYLEYSNPGYFDMMYHNFMGIGIMTVAMVVYLIAYVLSEHIFEGAFG